VGGDILANKKTFLMIHVMETANADQLKELHHLMDTNEPGKVAKVLQIFRDCKVDDWAQSLKEQYLQTALKHLEDTAVLSARKKPLMELAEYLITREH
jgi:geranylgeranyl diphosphate synthase type II